MTRPRLLCSLFAAALTVSLAPGAAQAGPAVTYATMAHQYNATAAAVNSTRALVYTLYNNSTPTTIYPTFAVTMPLAFSFPNGASTTCPGTSVTTSPLYRSGSTALPYTTWYVDGQLTAATPSCTITITVTSATEGTFSTCPTDISGYARVILPPGCTSIRFAVAHPARVVSPS
ncbi:hypothetical protein [Actinokineospora enzanensis]|uniref:DUF7933 domain-containing protein n=1 Tax=Actinokineospora enzanensis TaxID=155975 RepID=UPI00036E7D26|nr:hypothetical protein [Actinokineospora enzanensis]